MAPAASAGKTSHALALMTDLARVQCNACADGIAAHATAVPLTSRPTMQLSFFLTGAALEANLPKIWLRILEGNRKCEHETIEILFHGVAANGGDMDQAPVITPDLAKKIATPCFAGTNMNDVSNGINLSLMAIQDHTSPDNEKACFTSLHMVRDHNHLVSGSTAMDLTNLKLLCPTVKVQVPTAHMVTWLMLKACVLVLAMFLGETHLVVTDLADLVTWFTNEKSFYASWLQVTDSLIGPVRLGCCMQPQMCAWFLEIASRTVAAPLAGVVAPNFNQVWCLMTVGDMSWSPAMPLT